MLDLKKDRPILFGGPMVRSILGGRKTMTRRIFNLDPLDDIPSAVYPDGSGKGFIAWWGPGPHTAEKTARLYPGEEGIKCPYGQPGDRLWVRETWRIGEWSGKDGKFCIDYLADGFCRDEWLQCEDDDMAERLWIQCIDDCKKAGEQMNASGFYEWNPGESPCRIRPSIHMPRWASRINLEITGVRVERLQDISNTDARDEGFEPWPEYCGVDKYSGPKIGWNYIDLFSRFWDFINGKRKGCSWNDNPWVWVIDFCQYRS